MERWHFRLLDERAARRRVHDYSTDSSISLEKVDHLRVLNEHLIRGRTLELALTFLVGPVVELLEAVHVKLQSGLALISLSLQLLLLLWRVYVLGNSYCR